MLDGQSRVSQAGKHGIASRTVALAWAVEPRAKSSQLLGVAGLREAPPPFVPSLLEVGGEELVQRPSIVEDILHGLIDGVEKVLQGSLHAVQVSELQRDGAFYGEGTYRDDG